MPFFARGDGRILLWTIMLGVLVAAIWFCAKRARDPSTLPSRSSRLAAQAIVSGAIVALAMMVFATSIMPRIDSANKHRSREVARTIRAALPAGAQLWVQEDSYRPFWYYLEPDVRYFRRLTDLPAEAEYILLPATQSKAFLENPIWQGAPPVLIIQTVDNEKRTFDLYGRNINAQNSR